jgi:hypothetical protein
VLGLDGVFEGTQEDDYDYMSDSDLESDEDTEPAPATPIPQSPARENLSPPRAASPPTGGRPRRLGRVILIKGSAYKTYISTFRRS